MRPDFTQYITIKCILHSIKGTAKGIHWLIVNPSDNIKPGLLRVIDVNSSIIEDGDFIELHCYNRETKRTDILEVKVSDIK